MTTLDRLSCSKMACDNQGVLGLMKVSPSRNHDNLSKKDICKRVPVELTNHNRGAGCSPLTTVHMDNKLKETKTHHIITSTSFSPARAVSASSPSTVSSQVVCVNSFSQMLRRYTSLNHLAQAAHAVLQNSAHINQMLSDLNRVDFNNVQVCAASPVLCETE